MHCAIFANLNSWSVTWAMWQAESLVNASIVLALAVTLWLAIRKNAAAGLGYCLFLLVLVKLVVPLEIAVPDSLAQWTPARMVTDMLAAWGTQESARPVDRQSSGFADSMLSHDTPQRDSVSEVAASDADRGDLFGEPEFAARTDGVGSDSALADAAPQEDRDWTRGESRNTRSLAAPTAGSQTTWAEVPTEDGTHRSARRSGAVPTELPTRLAILGYLMMAWTLVACGLVTRFLWLQTRFRRRLGKARLVSPTKLSCDLRELCDRIGVRRRVRVVESDSVASPAVWGILRPVVILPEGLVESMSTSQLEWVLLHELAHIRRHDLAIAWFQRLVSIVYFLNPAVWVASRTINRLREYACDDMALRWAGGSRIDSSEAFMSVVRCAAAGSPRLNHALGTFDWDARQSCFRRMARLLDTDRRLRTRLGFGSLALLVLAASLTLPQPRAASEPGTGVEGMANASHDQPPTATLTGAVVDTRGRPVARSRVQLFVHYPPPSDWSEPVTTDSSGRFSIPVSADLLASPSLGSAVRAISPDGQSIGLTALGRRVGSSALRDVAKEPVTVSLMPLRATTIHVQNAQGRPVAGVKVEALVEFAQRLPSFTAPDTDLSGNTRVLIPHGVHIRDVMARKPGVGFDCFGNRRQDESTSLDFLEDWYRIADQLPERIELVLDGATTYRIRCEDTAGRPIPGVWLSPWLLQKLGKKETLNCAFATTTWTVTDAHGVVTFGWLPRTMEHGPIEFSLQASDYPTYQRPRVNVKGSDGRSTEPDVRIRLEPPAIISGKATDPRGEPLADVLVTCGSRRTLTARDGTYQIKAVPATDSEGATRNIEFQADGWALGCVRVKDPKPGQSFKNVDCVLTRGTVVRVRAVIDQGKTTFDQLLRRTEELGANLSIGPAVLLTRIADDRGGSFFKFLPYDGNGLCQMRLGRGSYKIQTQIQYVQFEEGAKEHEFVVPDEPRGNGELTFEFRANTVATSDYRFRVVRSDAPDVGLSGASISFSRDFSIGLYFWRQLRTNQNGRVVIRRSKGPVGYVATSDDGQWAAIGQAELEDKPTAGTEGTREITIPLEPAARVQGRFIDRAGEPITDGTVRIRPRATSDGKDLDNAFSRRPAPRFGCPVGNDGRFEFSGLPVGVRYRISLETPFETFGPNGQHSAGFRSVGSEWITLNRAETIDVGDIECKDYPTVPRSEPLKPDAVRGSVDAAAADRAIEQVLTRSAPKFHGTVVDQKGNPMAGCKVQSIGICSLGPTSPIHHSKTVKTDARGRFTISAGPLSDSTFSVGLRAETADGAQMGHVNPRTVHKTLSTPLPKLAEKPVEIVLAPVEETVVHVRDSQGRPVAGASVEAYVAYGDRLPPFSAEKTDASGNTRLRYPKGARVAFVLALKSGEGMDYFENSVRGSMRVDAKDTLPKRVDLTLSGALTRRIQLLDTSGRAIRGLAVRPWHLKKIGKATSVSFGWSTIACGVTDDRGIATIDWLPVDTATEGPATLSVVPVSHTYRLGYGFPVSCDPSDPDRLKKVVLAPCAVVSGKATLPDGSPAEAVRVVASTHDNQSPIANTDADGRYSLRLMPNLFDGQKPNSMVSNPERPRIMVSNILFHKQWVVKPLGPFNLKPGAAIDNADFQLIRGTQVRVRLVIDEGKTSFERFVEILNEQRPQPQQKPEVTLFYLKSHDAPQPAYRRGPARRDYFSIRSHEFKESGEATFRLPPGLFRLSPSVPCVTYEGISHQNANRGVSDRRPEREFTVSDSDTELTFEFRVSTIVTKEYRLKAVRADNPKVPVPDVAIMVRPDSRQTYQPIRLKTDENGEATLRRSTKPLTYLAYGPNRKLGASEEWLKLDPDTDVVTILMRPTRTATGRFLDRAGRPVANCRVVCQTTRTVPMATVSHEKARLILSDDPKFETTTDADGRFTVDRLIPGVGYEITAWKWFESYGRTLRLATKPFHVDVSKSADSGTIELGDVRSQIE